ncbi:hypothetical protein thsrh120_62800 [Rhizobium sp. No.120]
MSVEGRRVGRAAQVFVDAARRNPEAMAANLEAHLRELIEPAFEVTVIRDAIAG